MTYRDQLRWLAFDNHGVVTTAQAHAAGVPAVALRKLAARSVLRQVGYGVYRMQEVPATPLTEYAEAVALGGPGAMIADESVLALHDLALVNPKRIKVATTRRVRADLPSTVEIVRRAALPEPDFVDGLPTMPTGDALRACRGRVMNERLTTAAREAHAQGLLLPEEADRVIRDLVAT